MTREDELGALTDSELEEIANATLGELTEGEIRGGGTERPPIRHHEIRRFASRVERSEVLPLLEKWRTQDRGAKHAGGRPVVIDDRAVLSAVMYLRSEGRRIHVTELQHLFAYRLTPQARDELRLRVCKSPDTGDFHVDAERWYHRARRALIRVIVLMDAWPGPRVMTTRPDRVQILSLRDKNAQRLRQERAAQFATAMLLMPLKIFLPDLEETYRTGALSVDQTALHVFSARGIRRKDKKSGVEMAKIRPDGTEVDRWVLEMDAGYYPRKFSSENRESSDSRASTPDHEWMWALTTIATNAAAGLPKLIVGTSLNAPNKEIADETLRPVRELAAHGFTPAHLTGDRGYVQLGAAKYQSKLRDMGIKPLVSYKKTQLGISGGVAGSLQVEGDHYCPSTPKPLLNASVEFENKTIDGHTWESRIEERGKYRLRRKEKPDERGHYPMVCPAYGPQATVECPLRAIHPNSSKKPKPAIKDGDLPIAPDHVCTQTSVDFGPEDGIEHAQAIRYGTKEWRNTYKSDRQVVESLNNELKTGAEKLDDSTSRPMRGLAAQSFIILTGIVQINIRRIAKYLLELRRSTPKRTYDRRRDTEGLSDYVRADRSVDEGAELKIPDPPPPS